MEAIIFHHFQHRSLLQSFTESFKVPKKFLSKSHRKSPFYHESFVFIYIFYAKHSFSDQALRFYKELSVRFSTRPVKLSVKLSANPKFFWELGSQVPPLIPPLSYIVSNSIFECFKSLIRSVELMKKWSYW